MWYACPMVGNCECCGKQKRLEHDHDHATVLARGLICRSCNFAIGALGDSIEGLLRAVAYLQRPPSGLTYSQSRRVGGRLSVASARRWQDEDLRARMQRNGDQAKRYWDRLRADPVAYAEHCRKVREALRQHYGLAGRHLPTDATRAKMSASAIRRRAREADTFRGSLARA